jgi:hypothetical protein
MWAGKSLIVPLADVQHVEKHKLGIAVITKHTRWDTTTDTWMNNIWIGEDEAADFIETWCKYRLVMDGREI